MAFQRKVLLAPLATTGPSPIKSFNLFFVLLNSAFARSEVVIVVRPETIKRSHLIANLGFQVPAAALNGCPDSVQVVSLRPAAAEAEWRPAPSRMPGLLER